MSRKQTDRCIFCNWTRRDSYPNIRFFNIPKEPGLKKVRWLKAFGERKITHRDRVCSVHFRSGRPTNDPSHEDFVPHLYLNSEPPAEVMRYLEQAADKDGDARILAAEARLESMEEPPPVVAVQLPEEPSHGDRLLPLLPKKATGSRPAIMQRKRKSVITKEPERNCNETNENGTSPGPGTNPPSPESTPAPELASEAPSASEPEPTPASVPLPVIPKLEPEIEEPHIADNHPLRHLPNFGRNVKIVPINRYLIDVLGMQVGESVVIKRGSRKRPNPENNETDTSRDIQTHRRYMNGGSRSQIPINRDDDDDLPPPIIHMGGPIQNDIQMSDHVFLNDGNQLLQESDNHSRITQGVHDQYIMQPPQHIFSSDYPEDMYDVYADDYGEPIDPTIMASAQR